MKFWLKKLVWFLPCFCSAYAYADAEKNGYRTRSSPTMAVFYSVADDGRSTRKAIDVATISDPDAAASRVVVTGRPVSRRKAQHKKPVLMKVSISIQRAPPDSFAAHRCERSGFYYTNAGDCVVPVQLRQQERHKKHKKYKRQSKSGLLSAKPLNLMSPDHP
jgi:hypothetical protein